MRNSIRLALSIPQSVSLQPVTESIIDFSVRAEKLGYHSLWTFENSAAAVIEPIIALSYIASRTSKTNIGIATLSSPLRHPIVLAKQLSSLDFLSGGRLILGLALGASSQEYESKGESIGDRVPRFIESLQLIRKLWSSNDVDFHGTYWRTKGLTVEPKPPRGIIPVWLGGGKLRSNVHEKVLLRAANIADGWIGAGASSLSEFKDSVSKLETFLALAGKHRPNFTIAKRVYLHVDSSFEKAREKIRPWFRSGIMLGDESLIDHVAVYGTVEHCTEELRRHFDVGADLLVLHPVADEIEQIEIYMKDIMPKL